MIGDAKIVITSGNAPAALGPYSQGIRVGDFIFLSGQIGLNPKTGDVVSGGIKEQTDQVFKNISSVLDVAGSGLYQIVKTTVFMKSLADFGDMNAVYGKYFVESPPARSTVEVTRLPKDVLVEIECIAYSPKPEPNTSVGLGRV